MVCGLLWRKQHYELGFLEAAEKRGPGDGLVIEADRDGVVDVFNGLERDIVAVVAEGVRDRRDL